MALGEMVCPMSLHKDAKETEGRHAFWYKRAFQLDYTRRPQLFIKQPLCARNCAKQFHTNCPV